MGRPFVVDGKYRATTSLIGKIDESNAKTAWNIDQVPGSLANSSLNQEIALAFSNQGEGEHASVASFARHAMQLMSMGAPATLLIGSQQSAMRSNMPRCVTVLPNHSWEQRFNQTL